MPSNPLAAAQQRAIHDNLALDALFARYLGSADHPRGRVLTAYRNARRAMDEALREPSARRLVAAREVLDGLRRELVAVGQAAVPAAAAIGQESARRQAAAYAQDGVTLTLAGESADVPALLAGWATTVTADLAAIEALIRSGADAARIIGDERRVGALSPARPARQGANWLATAMLGGLTAALWGRDQRRQDEARYQKQAIACIDDRTTKTCLRVDGQIQPVDGKFHLTEEPRYADDLDWSPFHDYCRTSVALYLPGYDDGLTENLKADAAREWDRRGL